METFKSECKRESLSPGGRLAFWNWLIVSLTFFVPIVGFANGSTRQLKPTASFTLKTGIGPKGLEFIGVGGDINGKRDPDLHVLLGQTVHLNLIDGDGSQHDISIPALHLTSKFVTRLGDKVPLVFKAIRAGSFSYECSVPGHMQAGMLGHLIVSGPSNQEVFKRSSSKFVAQNIVRDPRDLPAPLPRRGPTRVRVNLEVTEVQGKLSNGTIYKYWTFNGKVPGPFIRVREGDTVEIHLKNPKNSQMIHSIDLHAVHGPGGGSMYMQVPPGQEKSFSFKALTPGLFVYHCATPMVAEHIARGMFGMILVEPKAGLPHVAHEFYIMQSEIYTTKPFGTKGRQKFSLKRLMREEPQYMVFNGAVGALTQLDPMHAKVGDTIRVFFGNAGPNRISSFHMIGGIFDRVYQGGSLLSAAQEGLQTVLVPPGSSAIIETKLIEPGRYVFVDHAIERVERGLTGFLNVSGKPNFSIFDPQK